MATQVQLRRGSTAQHSSFTGAAGEVTVDTDKDTAVVHDGSTAGGFPVASVHNANTWVKPQTPTSAAMTSTVAFDFSTYQVATLAVSGAFTVAAPSANPATGTYIHMVISMTASGTVSFNAVFKGLANYSQSTWSTGTMRDHLTFRWDGSTYNLVGVANGVNQ